MQYVQTSTYAEDPYAAPAYGYTTTAGYGNAPGKLLDLCCACSHTPRSMTLLRVSIYRIAHLTSADFPEYQYTTNPGPYMYERNADV